MGGELGGVIFDLGERALSKLPISQELQDATVKTVGKIFSMKSTLTGDAGKNLVNHIETRFEPAYDKQLAIHRRAAEAGNIIDHTGKIVPYSPPKGSTARTTSVPDYTVRANARNAARRQVFGSKDQALAMHIKKIEDTQGHNKAQMAVDHLGVYFHEKQFPVDEKSAAMMSQLVGNLKGVQATKELQFKLSPYKESNVLERTTKGAMTGALAYKAAAAHLSTPLNMLISQSASSFTKSMMLMMGHNYEGYKATLLASDSIGHVLFDNYSQNYRFRNGLINKYAPGSLGEFVHRNWAVPGLSALRERTIIAAAYQGEIVAHEAAERLMSGGGRSAEADLRWLGIDPTEVQASNGVLSPKHIDTARFTNANKTVFLESGLRRSYAASSSPLGRMVMMFHNYAAMQGNLITRSIYKDMVEKRDPVALLKTLATLGIIAPNVGNFTYALEQGVSKFNPFHPIDSEKKVIDDYKDRESGMYSGHWFAQNLESFTHIAGLGVATSYARAATRDKLSQAMLGPVLGAVTELGQDTAKLASEGFQPTAHHDQKMSTRERQLFRDVLHDVPSLGAGHWLANMFVPTTAELKARQPKTAKQIKAARARARRKQREQ